MGKSGSPLVVTGGRHATRDREALPRMHHHMEPRGVVCSTAKTPTKM